MRVPRLDGASPTRWGCRLTGAGNLRVGVLYPIEFGDAGHVGGGERYALELASALAERADTRLVTFGERRGARRVASRRPCKAPERLATDESRCAHCTRAAPAGFRWGSRGCDATDRAGAQGEAMNASRLTYRAARTSSRAAALGLDLGRKWDKRSAERRPKAMQSVFEEVGVGGRFVRWGRRAEKIRPVREA